MLWLPLSQVKSSVKFFVGFTRLKVLLKAKGEYISRKVIAFSPESPWLLYASRVRPKLIRFVIWPLRTQVWVAAIPSGWLHRFGAGVSGKAEATPNRSCW